MSVMKCAKIMFLENSRVNDKSRVDTQDSRDLWCEKYRPSSEVLKQS